MAEDPNSVPERSRGRSILAALTVLAVALGVVAVLALSLTQRGFSVVGDAADASRVVVRGVENTVGTDLVNRSDIPWEADEVAHLVGWAGITVVAGLLLRTRYSSGDVAVGAFAASFGIEVLQKLFVNGRNMQAEDVSANALGVMLGLMVVVAIKRLLIRRFDRPTAVQSDEPDRTPVGAGRIKK